MLTISVLSALEAIDRASVFDDITGVLGGFLERYGVSSYTAALIQSVARPKPEVAWVQTLSDDWTDQYFGEGWEAHDYALRKHGSGQATAPFFMGSSFIDRIKDLRDKEAEMFRAKEPHGLRSSLVVPMWAKTENGPTPTGYSLWSSDGGETFERMIASHGPEIYLVLHAAKDRIIPGLFRKSLGVAPLSKREHDCLLFAARGMSADAIADHLFLATVTVNVHLSTARKKLRVKTTTEAVARAIVLGLIDP